MEHCCGRTWTSLQHVLSNRGTSILALPPCTTLPAGRRWAHGDVKINMLELLNHAYKRALVFVSFLKLLKYTSLVFIKIPVYGRQNHMTTDYTMETPHGLGL